MTPLAFLPLLTLSIAGLGEPAVGELQVRGPHDIELIAAVPDLPEGCAVRTAPGVLRFTCSLPHDARLTFARPGWEPRAVEASQGVLDLHDDKWVPTPWPLRVSPPEAAAGARLVWLADEKVERAIPADDGRVLGPRVKPGTMAIMAVVGPNTAGALLKTQRPADGEVLEVPLAAGRSLALVCREPWSWSVLRNARVVVGKPLKLLRGAGLARVQAQAHVEGEEGLFLVAGYEDEALVVAEANELPPTLGHLAGDDGVIDIVFPPPHRLRVNLSDKKTGKPIADATIRIVALPHEVFLTEAKSDGGGWAEIDVARGRTRVVAEARGFRRAETELDIDQPRERADLVLDAATVLRGNVWDERGQPVSGATVMAAGQDMRVDGTENLAATGLDGAFEVTAPGIGPWLVWAEVPESSSPRTPVQRGQERLDLRLARECRVQILPLDTAGNAYSVRGLVCTGIDRAAIRLPDRVDPGGAIIMRLSPGRWRVWAEEERVSGNLEVPNPCEGLLLPVILSAPGGRF